VTRYVNVSEFEVFGRAPGETFSHEVPVPGDEDLPRERDRKQIARDQFLILVESGLLEEIAPEKSKSKSTTKEKHG
jgi:hypothetical protein